MTLYLMFISKRQNSTLQPTGGTPVNVYLKQDTSIINPTFVIESNNLDLNVNYCRCTETGRYYFIKDIICRHDHIYELVCEIDVLATFKTQILARSAFIKYASVGGSTRIPDPRIATTMDLTINHASAAFPKSVGGNNYFISMNSINGVETYYVTRNDISQMFRNLDWSPITVQTGSDDKETIKNIGEAICTAMEQQVTEGNAFQWLQSAYILPFPPDAEVLGGSKRIYAGFYDTGVSGEPLVTNVFSEAIAISIPWNFTDWRSLSPYTDVYLYLPFFGTIALDVNSIIGSSYLTVKYSISYSNGDLSYSVETQTNRIIATGKCNVKSDYSVGSVNNGSVLSGLASTAAYDLGGWGQAASKIPIIGKGLSGLMNAAAGSVSTFAKGAATAGGLGGFSDCGLDLRLHCWVLTKNFSDSQANFAALNGYPVMAVQSLSGKTGYIETAGFSMDGSGTSQEKEMINDLLDTGIYIE